MDKLFLVLSMFYFLQSWKLYVCKKNANVDASVVTVSLAEVSDIVENIGAKIEEIQDGIKQKSHSIAQKIQESMLFQMQRIWIFGLTTLHITHHLVFQFPFIKSQHSDF